MGTGAITGYIDVAQLTLYVFWIFFAGLIFYISRESRREGYPKTNMAGDRIDLAPIYAPSPKQFRLADGRVVSAPDAKRDDGRPVMAKPMDPGEGAPLIPTGNPMADGVGPAAWAERADIPDVTYEGKARIVPMRIATDFKIDGRDYNMIGKKVVGADGKQAGTVRDIWIDRSEYLIRYIELELSGGRRVLLPMPFADIRSGEDRIVVDAILADQFAGVPTTKSPDTITLREEDRIAGYYGGGLLYATPERQETLI